MDIIYRFNPYEPVECTTFKSADEALDHLREGHCRHLEIIERLRSRVYGGPAEDVVISTSLTSRGVSMVPGVSLGQRPFAIVISCSDARAPIEEIFQVNANSVFVVRVAGHVLGTEVMGSIIYAMTNFADSVRLIVVLGHTECGAVTAAVKSLSASESGTSAFPPAVAAIVNQIQPSVKICGCRDEHSDREALSREALIESSCYVHSAKTAMDLRRELGLSEDSLPQVVYGVYDLSSTQIRSRPSSVVDSDCRNFLAAAPNSEASLQALASKIVAEVGASTNAEVVASGQGCTAGEMAV